MVDPLPCIESDSATLRSRVLKKPIDNYLSTFAKKAIYAYKRVTNSEVLMSRDVFVTLGLSQPAWITIEAESKYLHLAMAFMLPSDFEDDELPLEDDKRDSIVLSPMLEACYSPNSHVVVKPYKGRIECQDSEEEQLCTDIIHWQSGFMPRVNSIEFELIYHSATQVRPTEEIIQQSLLEHPI